MSSMIGERLKISIFGQSHGDAIGVVMDGLPVGESIDIEELQSFLDRRAPGRNDLSTQRREADIPHFLSGINDGVTCGAPLCAIIYNKDICSQDYAQMKHLMRPSHADYPAHIRYGGYQDMRGGGHFSGRLTAPLCIAGGIAKQILARKDIFIGAHLQAVGKARDVMFSSANLTKEELLLPASRIIPVLNRDKGLEMEEEIRAVRLDGDSIGGIVECGVIGISAGIGDPMFDGIENCLSTTIFGIPGIRGIEFGAGFMAAEMKGSVHNDPYLIQGDQIKTETNNHGGVLGGITTGMPIIFRVAVKPTPSIAKEQNTVDIGTGKETVLNIKGRHDPCIALRIVPCIEAAAAITVLDLILKNGGNI
ncbi:MAG: chorismate synthase [Eubacteriales bacterium]|nr:chorismate synthase [Eubacteriales bacterium]MDD4390751.1 chorismate synthase [Eubacteriales bacterium]